MAGLPLEVVERSMDLMQKMQKKSAANVSTRKKTDVIEIEAPQLNLF